LPDTYGVTPADVASELKGLYPTGFSTTTVPTLAQVTEWISTADDIVRLHLIDETGTLPAASDSAARLAKTYIREWVKAQVIRAAYAGNDSTAIDAASRPYADLAKQVLKELDDMGSQAVGPGSASPGVGVAYTVPNRELAVTDDELDMDDNFRTRKY
jgi:hypothetical protein